MIVACAGGLFAVSQWLAPGKPGPPLAGSSDPASPGTPLSPAPLVSTDRSSTPEPIAEERPDGASRQDPRRFEGRGSIRGLVRLVGNGELPDSFRVVVEPSRYLVGQERAVSRSMELSPDKPEFTFEDLPFGGYDVRAEARHMNGPTFSVLLQRGSPSPYMEVALSPAGLLDGTVLDSFGRPIEGLPVTLEGEEDGVRRETVTDAAGGYVFRNVLDGDYIVYFGAPDNPLREPTAIRFRAPAMNLPVSDIAPHGNVKLYTLDEGGDRLAEVRVRGYASEGGSFDTTSDLAGEAWLRFLHPGRVRIMASTEDGRKARVEFELDAGEVRNIQMRLR